MQLGPSTRPAPDPELVSPLLARLALDTAGERHKKKPRPIRFRAKAVQLKDVQSTPSSPQAVSHVTLKRSASAPEGEEIASPSEGSSKSNVPVPRADDETFTEFYSSLVSEKMQNQLSLDIKDDDLDVVVSQSNSLLVQKKCIQVQRRKFTSRNPIKSLQARTDLRQEYEEVKVVDIAEKTMKNLKIVQLAKHTSLAVEALAGLASKEDFTAIALKKAVASPTPYKELMLLLIKGRRHVQTRLIEPLASSINSGDSYVLITPNEVFNWIGRYSNVIERSRGAEVAQHIVNTKELGYSGSGLVITICEEKVTCSRKQEEQFWQFLGAHSMAAPIKAGHPDEDELYETSVVATNMIFQVHNEELGPIEEYWGAMPSIKMLDPAKILLFDFGSELYVWTGKNAPMDERRQAQKLAHELWDQGYDYSECDVCPVNVALSLGSRSVGVADSLPTQDSTRPPWAVLARVTQHMETILFREKFLDWPDFSRVIHAKGSEENEKQSDASIDIKPCSAEEMLEVNASEPDLILENTHLGRGCQYFDVERHQHYDISTLGITVWHVSEYESTEVPHASFGQFHTGDSYVVRWQYSVTVTGRELGSGQPSRHSIVGRDRCVYFFWQGRNASVSEQGAAALLTVELDRENGPQVRTVQGTEPPAFLRLFNGCMAVHYGHRDSESSPSDAAWENEPWKLFLCRGEMTEEAVLVQIPCSVRQLRSRTGLILINTNTGVLYVWYGSKASQDICQIIRKAAENIKKNKPPEYGFKSGAILRVNEEREGQESKEFFKGLGGCNRLLYVSLVSQHQQMNYTPRLFHLSSTSGIFIATEVLGPYSRPTGTTAYPFLQEDLYSTSQPALFLLDNDSELWLWQGWWPSTVEDEMDTSTLTGTGSVRWQAERRAAMQTALDYWGRAHPGFKSSNVPAFLVWAGLEPLSFTNLFPMWTDRDDIAELNIRDGRKPGEIIEVETELARLSRSTYPPAQLLQRPLPDGVDPTRLELYLESHHFQELLRMPKEEFLDLPTWKQTKLKKEVGLF